MRRIQRPPEDVLAALDAVERGESIAAVCRRMQIPRPTIANWRRGQLPQSAQMLRDGTPLCAVCGGDHEYRELDVDAYVYLLAVYLGDGCLDSWARSRVLRVSLDSEYAGIITEVSLAIEDVCGRAPNVARHRVKRMVTVCSYWKSWPCLFPQHGPGKKHLRPIVLEPWQRALVEQAPGRFLRGLIHTDGWRGENRVTVKGRDYSYPRYQFSSRSDDIRRLFCDACDTLGIAWRPWGRWHVSVARKEAVARLDEHVGLKG